MCIFKNVTLVLRKGNMNPFCYIEIIFFLGGNILAVGWSVSSVIRCSPF